MKTEATAKTKAVKHVFVLDGNTYERTSPRVYTHIIIGDQLPCSDREFNDSHECGDYCNRKGLVLGWSQSEANARKAARTMENRKVWINVRVFEVTRQEAK